MARILVIDDDPAVRELFRQILEDAGYQVVDAQDGRVGVARFKEYDDIRLIITDMLMPEKDGVEVIMEMKEQYPHVRIIAISGGGRGLDAGFNLMVAKDFGAHRTLAKPFSRTELLDVVQELLEEG